MLFLSFLRTGNYVKKRRLGNELDSMCQYIIKYIVVALKSEWLSCFRNCCKIASTQTCGHKSVEFCVNVADFYISTETVKLM